MKLLDKLAYKFLRKLSPERAHGIAKWAMKRHLSCPVFYGSLPTSTASRDLFGYTIQSPLGLAAGFDKNGELPLHAAYYGFGWVEVGSVTWRGGPGNPKPRLFRRGHHLLNRMGLNGLPAEVVADNLKFAPNWCFAVNIAKTHDPNIMGDRAIMDINHTYAQLKDMGIYTALNISCPNTAEGKTFEDPIALAELLSSIRSMRRQHSKPLLLKLSPQVHQDTLDKLVDVAQSYKVDGFIACNTKPYICEFQGLGGLSGPSLFEPARRLVEFLVKETKKPVIACGGIHSGKDVRDMLLAGAVACQAYTGFVVGPNAGPRFAYNIWKELVNADYQPDRSPRAPQGERVPHAVR